MRFSTLGRSSPKTSIHARLEVMEPRRLMSGAWTTVDAVPNSEVAAMTTDAAGNVYAMDYGGAVREKLSTSADVPGSWTTIAQFASTAYHQFYSIAADGNGNVFIAGEGPGPSGGDAWQVYELPKGAPQGGFQLIDDVPSGLKDASAAEGLALDAAGNIYVVGDVAVPNKNTKTYNESDTIYWTARQGSYDAATGTWSFRTVDQISSGVAHGVSIINSGSVAGIYVVGDLGQGWGQTWVVRKSTDGGKTWTQSDSYRYDSSGIAVSFPRGIVEDLAGNLYVAGYGEKATITGYNRKTPQYSYIPHWLVRKSSDGGISWSVDDDFQYSPSVFAKAAGIGVDQAGNVYVAGIARDSSNVSHAVVRDNQGGWHNVDDYGQAWYGAFAVDSVNDLFAGGADSSGSVIRSAPASTIPSSTASPAFSTTLITTSNTTSSDSSTSWLKRRLRTRD